MSVAGESSSAVSSRNSDGYGSISTEEHSLMFYGVRYETSTGKCRRKNKVILDSCRFECSRVAASI